MASTHSDFDQRRRANVIDENEFLDDDNMFLLIQGTHVNAMWDNDRRRQPTSSDRRQYGTRNDAQDHPRRVFGEYPHKPDNGRPRYQPNPGSADITCDACGLKGHKAAQCRALGKAFLLQPFMRQNSDFCTRIAKNWERYKTPKANAVMSEYIMAACCNACA